MSASATSAFEMRGEFLGFFRDLFGKRRMALRAEGEEVYLKVPRELRPVVEKRFRRGDEVVASGTSEVDGRGRVRLTVEQLWRAGQPEVCAVCPIQVCTKKNCWRDGGRELWAELERGLAKAGLDGIVQLEGVNCLDRCKQAPNADWNGREYRRCGPRDAAAIIEDVSRAVTSPQSRDS